GNNWIYDGGSFRPALSWDFAMHLQDVDELAPGGYAIPFGVSPSDPSTFPGHGTHTSGIVAATSNRIGVAGACWNCSLMMARINFRTGQLANAITWLTDHGAQAINMSFGYTGLNAPEMQMVSDALDFATQRGVVLTASSGNDLADLNFPASDARVLAIGGIQADGSFWKRTTCPFGDPTHNDLRECGSNYAVTPGSRMSDLMAPADSVLSTVYTGKDYDTDLGCGQSTSPTTPGYGLCTGTSMSAPYVAGIVGLLRSANPLLKTADVRAALIRHASHSASQDPKIGYGVPNAAASVADVLGIVAGRPLTNRLTPLFSFYSGTAKDHFYTTSPQMASAALFGNLYETCERVPGASCATSAVSYQPVGPQVPWYAFPGYETCPSPCTVAPRASVYIFSGDTPPVDGAPPLVPLYRMHFKGASPTNPSASNRNTTYTTEPLGLVYFKNLGFELDGIEGYIYKSCSPEPGCIPSGAVRLYRYYNSTRDDYAIFPESELAQMQADGYVGPNGLNDTIGYVYPNVDSDGDNLIDGFETLIGTDPQKADSDCDGISDGTEIFGYPAGDPLSSPGCLPPNDSKVLSQKVTATMLTGHSYTVSITVKNVGSQAWSPVGPTCNAYRLGSLNTNWNVNRADLSAAVAPGKEVTFTFNVIAPKPGTYNFQWRMVQECVTWFGELSPNVAVNVLKSNIEN
ncbi:MAG TPA: S8 family serine peptidase, partial [Acidimicrobiales bacterium]|nr:S8 family serine peptidase [Acidimicrobiales bacterium]